MRKLFSELTSGTPGRALAALLAGGIGALACDQPVQPEADLNRGAPQRGAGAATFEVTVQNTAGALQPFTPSVVALHNPAATVFEVGQPASEGVERIAESGNIDPLREALGGVKQVLDVGVAPGPAGPIKPGQQGTVTLQGPPGLRVSLVSMLVCTNDGITGLNSVRLPERVGETVTYTADGYDAGTERNTEAASDIVPPCVAASGGTGGSGADQPQLAEDEVIRHHPGIVGDAFLTVAEHQWTDPVARVTIERVQ